MRRLLVVLALVALGCGESAAGETVLDAAAAGDTGGASDVAIDVSATPDDAGEPDVAAADLPSVEADTEILPGKTGWPCVANEDCESGYCVTTAAGSQCSEACVESCPFGWLCKLVQGGGGVDVVYICVSPFTHLCDPCNTDGDCTKDNVSTESRCVSYGERGSFCGAYCGGTGECPAGYSCETVSLSNGASTEQCRPIGGQCSCSSLAKAQGASTACSASGPSGSCTGVRSCGDAGLTACDALPPSEEVCNGFDDDCDGVPDDDCDKDGVAQDIDNCPTTANSPQTDTNGDGEGDACDADDDGDFIPDPSDCAPLVATVHPGAQEVCDLLDNDCDSATDEGLCDDLEPCTENICAVDGSCVNPPKSGDCDDGDQCTQKDVCSAGSCVGADALDCNDKNACTTDSCDPIAGCEYETQLTGPCDDGDACSLNDTCIDGKCKAGIPNPCTDDNQCTLDTCAGGCGHVAINPCSDGNPCTTDACFPAQCVFAPVDGTCSDGSVCTQVDACSAGECVGGSPLQCDDGKPCTDNICDSQTGCYYPENHVPCEDGSLCTTPDFCQSGECVAGGTKTCSDSDPCTVDSCDPQAGCLFTLSHSCSDGNACTDDLCESFVGCKFPDNGDTCTDNNACTSGDKCQGGQCEPQAATNCDDGEPCTADECNPATGCFKVPSNSGPCDDGNQCTPTDTCLAGVCTGSGAKVCVDSNPCTTDTCDAVAGCVFVNNTDPCNDGNECTTGDTCGGGECTPGGPYCGSPCTLCLPAFGLPLCFC